LNYSIAIIDSHDYYNNQINPYDQSVCPAASFVIDEGLGGFATSK
jgi:hypothetical protein